MTDQRPALGGHQSAEDSPARIPPECQNPSDDHRFTIGLLRDVAKVLVAHGYPDRYAEGAELVDLRQALSGHLYDRTGRPWPRVRPRPSTTTKPDRAPFAPRPPFHSPLGGGRAVGPR